NQVSIVSILIGIASGWFFATGQFLTGAIVLQICAIIDCVDGDLARALFKQSPLGKWIDLIGDQIVHFAVFLGIGVGIARQDPSTPALLLGASAAIGVVFCLLVIVRGMNMTSDHQSLFGKLVDATANRDFSALLLFLAIIGRMQWFLWMAGIGIHLFWITMLALQMHAMRRFREA
ncbi:MAG TPA: CDP-alcohol phosphatidyltransferase family protein, partial [Chthoniobacterales bacterium]|nr:CDP-alcohol phosphatidyltransferase family protein [Chthoniobacterales bacterium]